MAQQKTLTIHVSLTEDERHTEARAAIDLEGGEVTGSGIARRNPVDPNVPMIGEELATARALTDLSHNLIETAAKTLEAHIGSSVDLSE